jgi:hypothetical protein
MENKHENLNNTKCNTVIFENCMNTKQKLTGNKNRLRNLKNSRGKRIKEVS